MRMEEREERKKKKIHYFTNCAEGVVLSRGRAVGQHIEESRLAVKVKKEEKKKEKKKRKRKKEKRKKKKGKERKKWKN